MLELGPAEDESFRDRFPNASLGIMEGLSASVVEWITTGRADIGLVFNPAASPALEILPVHEEPMFLVGPPGERSPRALALKDLPRHPLIIPSRPNANRMRIEAQLAYFGLKPNIAFEVDGIGSILEMVREGYGSAVLPLASLRAYGVVPDPPARVLAEWSLAPDADGTFDRRLSIVVGHAYTDVCVVATTVTRSPTCPPRVEDGTVWTKLAVPATQ